jgi:FkbM family methyltransferase
VISKLILGAIKSIVLMYLLVVCIVTFRFSSLKSILVNLRNSKSQFYQDLMVIAFQNQRLESGEFFFVEFGATNGIDLSNTYLFENEFSSRGIVAEPAKVWHSELFLNRNCQIVTDCVWSHSNLSLEFFESENPDLSGLKAKNHFLRKTQLHDVYSVRTISMMDLLKNYNAPQKIDLLSIDTEGTELEILSSFDFSKYTFNIIVCEHNFSKDRKKIQTLLEKNGYCRRLSWISFVDDWYFLSPDREPS